MTDHGQVFSAPMVRALIREAGSPGTGKTMTRRLFGTTNSTVNGERVSPKSPAWRGLKFDHPAVEVRSQSSIMVAICGKDAPYDPHISVPFVHPGDAADGMKWEDDPVRYRVRPIYEVGDRIWVRENFRLGRGYDGVKPCGAQPFSRVWYAADDANDNADAIGKKLHPSIHMPRWASRLTLVVTGVKVERLQDIGEDDAKAEGLLPTARGWWSGAEGQAAPDPRSAFALLWTSINGPQSWAANPPVMATTFTVHLCKIIPDAEANRRFLNGI